MTTGGTAATKRPLHAGQPSEAAGHGGLLERLAADGGGTENATTEIALALAMAFFSLLVLTFVSMSNGQRIADRVPDHTDDRMVRLLEIAAADRSGEANPRPLKEGDQLLILADGRFLDPDLRTVQLNDLPQGRVVLAVDPAAPVADLLDARGRLAGRDVQVATLNPAWLARLGQRVPDERARDSGGIR